MANTALPKPLTIFAEVASEVFAERWPPDHCLPGSRVAVEVFKKLGIDAKPLSAETLAMNRVWREQVAAKGRWPESQQEADRWVAAGGFSFAVTPAPRLDQWAGHLVVIARGCLVDSAAVQFQRPDKKLTPPDIVVADLSPRFWDGEPMTVEFEDGSCIMYRALPDKSFLDQLAYSRLPGTLDVAAEVVARMKSRLGR